MSEHDDKRLIEVAFPLKQASIDSVHEKMCHAGHIKAIHIWPARRPLAACRAALICTLLPDPGDEKERKKILERLGGKVVEKVQKKKMPNGRVVESIKEETEGGILHWKRENGPDLEWFRQEIRKAYGGRTPKVLDPFAGGGAIPLEAMRLGCEATAIDINPVAWFILKCTLEYPQKLAGQTRPLPDFALQDRDFMESFFKTKGLRGAQLQAELDKLGHTTKGNGEQGSLIDNGPSLEADLAWHVRAWGMWVLRRARKDLAPFYPTYADFEPADGNVKDWPRRDMQLVPLRDDGTADIEALNAEFSETYLKKKKNPRWVAKPTMAYLWARTVQCKNCRATVPLLKTRWLCKKPNKRVLLTMEPNDERTGVVFGIQDDVPRSGGNAAQRREHDRRIGAGTMSSAGVACPCCDTIMTMDDLRVAGKAHRLGVTATAVVVDGQNGKEYRLSTEHEQQAASTAEGEANGSFADIPLGVPDEPLPSENALGMRIPKYGYTKWIELFTARQLLSLGTLVREIRAIEVCPEYKPYSENWRQPVLAYLACILGKVADYNSAFVTWQPGGEKGGNTFVRWALPMKWDFVESNPLGEGSGSWPSMVDWVSTPIGAALPQATAIAPHPHAFGVSATFFQADGFDVIVTDPPYYDAIPYSDLMDFFYVWLRRVLHGLNSDVQDAFRSTLGPKWDQHTGHGELVDDSSRFNGDATASRRAYEDGMFRAFVKCSEALTDRGRFVLVFANKQPDAWEALVSVLHPLF